MSTPSATEAAITTAAELLARALLSLKNEMTYALDQMNQGNRASYSMNGTIAGSGASNVDACSVRLHVTLELAMASGLDADLISAAYKKGVDRAHNR